MAWVTEDYLNLRMEKWPSKLKTLVACRAAMRVFPALAKRRKKQPPFEFCINNNDDLRAKVLLEQFGCFRATMHSLLAENQSMVVRRAVKALVRISDAGCNLAVMNNSSNSSYGIIKSIYEINEKPIESIVKATNIATPIYMNLNPLGAMEIGLKLNSRELASSLDKEILDIHKKLDKSNSSMLNRIIGVEGSRENTYQIIKDIFSRPLWVGGMPRKLNKLWRKMQKDIISLNAGYAPWLTWYQDVLDGKSQSVECENEIISLLFLHLDKPISNHNVKKANNAIADFLSK